MINKLVVPPFGELEEIKVLEWHKREGDAIQSGDLIVELELDKAIVEVTAEQAGVLRRTLCADGEWHKLGSVLAVLSSAPDEPLPENVAAEADMLAKFEAV